MRYILIILAFICSSCVFQPLYKSADANFANQLAAIEIMPIEFKASKIFVRQLDKKLNPLNLNINKKYKLQVSINSSDDNSFVREDSFIQQVDTTFNVVYKLTDAKGLLIANNNFTYESSYKTSDSSYATYVNDNYNYEISLKHLAEQLKSRLIIDISNYCHNENCT